VSSPDGGGYWGGGGQGGTNDEKGEGKTNSREGGAQGAVVRPPKNPDRKKEMWTSETESRGLKERLDRRRSRGKSELGPQESAGQRRKQKRWFPGGMEKKISKTCWGGGGGGRAEAEDRTKRK